VLSAKKVSRRSGTASIKAWRHWSNVGVGVGVQVAVGVGNGE